MDDKKKPNKVRVGGLWQGKSGVLSGNMGPLRIVIFPEKKKKSDKSPDFTLWLEEAERKEGTGGGGGSSWGTPKQPPSDGATPVDDSDIPFVFQE